MERGLLARLYSGDDDCDRTPEDRESLSQSALIEPRDVDLIIPGIIISRERWDRAIVVTAESSNSNSKSSTAG
jgi:hypothetical protein